MENESGENIKNKRDLRKRHDAIFDEIDTEGEQMLSKV
jgi:hypothetical protein